jgi:hypothetical protein
LKFDDIKKYLEKTNEYDENAYSHEVCRTQLG